MTKNKVKKSKNRKILTSSKHVIRVTDDSIKEEKSDFLDLTVIQQEIQQRLELFLPHGSDSETVLMEKSKTLEIIKKQIKEHTDEIDNNRFTKIVLGHLKSDFNWLAKKYSGSQSFKAFDPNKAGTWYEKHLCRYGGTYIDKDSDTNIKFYHTGDSDWFTYEHSGTINGNSFHEKDL